jgi:PIN domain nuclease of toxin-antitoxin system
MYLLDTHVLLWGLMDAPQLPERMKAILRNPVHQIWVSSASVWEIFIKKNLGKLQIPDNLEEFITASGFKQLPISFEHAQIAGLLPRHHEDPFDRMLIAQASVEGLKLITADSHFTSYEVSILKF